jgi:hypothetical protein
MCSFGTVSDTLDRMMQECPPDKLPVWSGELYFELHPRLPDNASPH